MSEESPIVMLLVDDKSITSSLDRAGYRAMGVQVIAISRYQEAVQILREKSVEIIVANLDYLGDGAKMVCHVVRTSAEGADIPIVVTSVQANSKYKAQALAAGANLFVEQPVPRSYFIEKIKDLLTKATRGQDRVPAKSIVSVSVNFDGDFLSLPLGDISSSGMLISTEDEYQAGKTCSIELKVPRQAKPISIEGEVVRVLKDDPKHPERKPGIGIRFSKFNGASEKKLLDFLDRHQHEGNDELRYYL